MLKYGSNAFSFEVLEFYIPCKSLTSQENIIRLRMLEIKFIAELNPEYNILRLAGNRISHKLSPDTRARISAAKSTVRQEARALVSAARIRKGVIASDISQVEC